jgi:dolichol-phosphate mannosyltransferase
VNIQRPKSKHPEVANRQKIQFPLVIIPTYNERESLPSLFTRIPSIPNLEFLFVDDHSTDGTVECIREWATQRPGIHLLERPGKLGLGTAYVTGFRWALERNYDAIFEMDADLSHDPNEIPNFIRKLDQGADLVLGSRYLNGIRIINWPLRRLVLSRLAASYTRMWTRLPLSDPTSGFKCFRREVLESINLDRVRANGYAFQIEMDYFAWKLGFKIHEIPIIFTDRYSGHSKMNPKIVREAVWFIPSLVLLTPFWKIRRKRP